MRKIKGIVCILAVGLVLTACGGSNGESGAGSGNVSGSSDVESSAGSTQESSGEVESTVESTVESAPESGSAGGPDFETGTWSEEMDAVKQAVVDKLGDNYFPNSMIEPELLEGIYGVTEEMYDDYYGEMPMISTNVDAILVVKARDGKATDVEAALNAYRDKMVNDTFQYPMNLGKIQASIVRGIGNYVCFVQLGGDVTDALEKGDEAVIEQCQEQNELALEAIEAVVE